MHCTKCAADKPTSEFQPVPPQRNKRLFDSWCKACHRAGTKAWQKRNPAKRAAQKRRSKIRQYNLDPAVYDRLVFDAEGRCAICLAVPTRGLDVDHDHETGAVRGLLCNRCNKVLGIMKDSPTLLRACAAYLEGIK